MTRRLGVMTAGATALVSGVSVYVNGDAVRRFDDATAYTTLKNSVAGLVVLLAGTILARRSQQRDDRPHLSRGSRSALAVVAVVGGAVPFVLFFEGLQRASSSDAAFIHKTLVVWVAVGATVALRERLGALHVTAIVLVLWGQAELAGGVGLPESGSGEAMIIAATWCWAVEVVLAKWLLADVAPLTVARARMVGGSLALVAWCLLTGRAAALVDLDIVDVGWLLLTGLLLGAYVLTWFHALAWAQAVDVTAVLVGGAAVTALLNGSFRGADLAGLAPGMALIALGVTVVVVASLRRPALEVAR